MHGVFANRTKIGTVGFEPASTWSEYVLPKDLFLAPFKLRSEVAVYPNSAKRWKKEFYDKKKS